MMKRFLVILLLALAPVAVFATGGAEATDDANGREPLSMFVPGNPNIDPTNDVVLDALAEGSNTDLDIEMPPRSGYNERLQILFAGGDLPDIVEIPQGQLAIFRQTAEDGFAVALDDYLDDAPNIMAAVDPGTWFNMRVLDDGLVYGIPKPTMNRQDGFAIRKDWLDQFGMSVPESGIMTMDDFLTAMRHFTFDDPDGNGRDDTYGIGLRANQVSSQLNGTFRLLGWQPVSEGPYDYMNAMYDRHSDHFKTALEYMRMFFEEGLANPDWQANTWDQFLSGQNGIQATLAGNLPPRQMVLRENFPEAELDYIARVVLNEGDEPAGAGFSQGAMWGLNIVTSGADERGRVEKAISFLDYSCDPDRGWEIVTHGVEGVHYNVVNGEKVYTPAYDSFAGVRKSYAWVRIYNDNRFTIGPANMEPAQATQLVQWTEQSQMSLYRTRDLGYNPEAARTQEYIDYQSILEETITKIILGQEPVSAWDAALDGWYENGGEELVAEMNEYIARVNP